MSKISIITVCFNSKDTIKKTFDSLLSQTYKDFEYIVVDGKSTDGTLEIIREYYKLFNGKMKYISEQDNGLYDAMNKGIDLCTGEYIGILNSDDWYENNTIELVKKNIEQDNSIDIYYGYIRIIKDNKEYMVRRNNYDFILEGTGLIQHPTCFIKKSSYNRFGVYDTRYKVCADQDLMLRMVTNGAKYKAIDSILTNFVVGGTSFRYDSSFENNEVKFKYGIISKNYKNKYMYKHIIRYIKLKMKNMVRNK